MRRPDVATVAMHIVALAVWPLAVGWTVYRLLTDKFPATPATVAEQAETWLNTRTQRSVP